MPFLDLAATIARLSRNASSAVDAYRCAAALFLLCAPALVLAALAAVVLSAYLR